MSRGKVVIVDGTNLAYRAFYMGGPALALRIIKNSLISFSNKFAPERYVVVFDSLKGDLFRKSIDPTYKAQRIKNEEAVVFERIVHRFVRRSLRYNTLTIKGRDGDDLIYTLMLEATERAYGVVIVTADKDLLMLVSEEKRVEVFDPMKKEHYQRAQDVLKHAKLRVRADQVEDFLCLAGDRVDNVKGVPGIGPVKARSIIANKKELRKYRKNEDFLRSQRMVRLNRVTLSRKRLPWYEPSP